MSRIVPHVLLSGFAFLLGIGFTFVFLFPLRIETAPEEFLRSTVLVLFLLQIFSVLLLAAAGSTKKCLK